MFIFLCGKLSLSLFHHVNVSKSDYSLPELRVSSMQKNFYEWTHVSRVESISNISKVITIMLTQRNYFIVRRKVSISYKTPHCQPRQKYV
jgi:hypothetical protein